LTGQGSSSFQMKWIASIAQLGFKVSTFNGVHDSTLFKFFKRCVNIELKYTVRCTNFKS